MAVTLKQSMIRHDAASQRGASEKNPKMFKGVTSVHVTFRLWWNLHLRSQTYRRRLIGSYTLKV